MNIKRFVFLVVMMLVASSSSLGQQLSHDELVEVLGIQSWRVPSPKHRNRQWSLEIADYASRKFDNSLNTELFDPQQKALIVLRDLGEDRYRYSLKQREGMSQGEFKVNLCSPHWRTDTDCEESYEIVWYATPKPFDNGTKLLLADIKQMTQKKYRQQIVLELTIIQPE